MLSAAKARPRFVWLVRGACVATPVAHLIDRSIRRRRAAAVHEMEAWGRPVVADRDPDQVSRYHVMVGRALGVNVILEQVPVSAATPR
ncbi:MAG: hypothetical protein ACR2GG_04475 [Gemmatimonadaceae bacterium]